MSLFWVHQERTQDVSELWNSPSYFGARSLPRKQQVALPGCSPAHRLSLGFVSLFWVVAAFLQVTTMPPRCWRFIPHTSSPSYLELLRTHFAGAKTQEGVKVAASNGQKPTTRGQAERQAPGAQGLTGQPCGRSQAPPTAAIRLWAPRCSL